MTDCYAETAGTPVEPNMEPTTGRDSITDIADVVATDPNVAAERLMQAIADEESGTNEL